MDYIEGNKVYFPGIGKIKYEGPESKILWLSGIMMRTRK